MHKYPWFFSGILFTLVFFVSCSVNKVVPDGSMLLKKNKVIITKSSKFRQLDGSNEQLFLKPNRKILANSIPFYLWHYVYLTPRKIEANDTTRRERKRLRKRNEKLAQQKIEAPALVDTLLINLSANNLRNYFINNGYLLASVTTKIDTIRRKKAIVSYHVQAGPLHKLTSFFIDTINREIQNEIKEIIDSLGKNKITTTFSPWQLNGVSYEELDNGRRLIATAMQNRGYFMFNAAQIYYIVDTFSVPNEIDPYRIKITLYYNETTNPNSLKKFLCKDIVLNIYSTDSTGPAITELINGTTIISNYKKLDNAFLANMIIQEPNQTYNQNKFNKTIQNLSDLGVFERADMSFSIDSANQQVSAIINTKVGKRQSTSAEPQGLVSPQGTANLNGFNANGSRNASFGLALVLNYTNKNLKKRAQRLSISSISSYEAVFKRANVKNLGTAFQQGFNFSYSVPHYNGIGKIDKFMEQKLGFISRKTIFNLNTQYERNINFTRNVIPANWTIQFSKPNTDLFITPVEFSYSLNKADPDYLNSLSAIDIIYVKSVFTNNITSPFRVQLNTVKNFLNQKAYVQFNTSGESSGNLFRTFKRLTDDQFSKDKSYTLFNQQYFQYVKLDGQMVFNKRIDALNSIAFRVRGGIAAPYGNSKAVPYDKRYFIGGSNSLRAWRPRQMGPGNKPEDPNAIIDRSGELLIEANFEYRFVVSRNFLEMALFYDAGNIWNTGVNRQPPNTPGLLYDASQIANEMAMDAGLGFRFDFTFFIFRFDWAWAVFDPGKIASERWVLTTFPKPTWKNLVNYGSRETAAAIGIGYPF